MKPALFCLLAVPALAASRELPAAQSKIDAERARTWGTAGWTGSMYPELRGGERLRFRKTPYAALRVGSRVRFWPVWSARPVAHVILRNAGSEASPRWVTGGINCRFADPGFMGPDTYMGTWEAAGLPCPPSGPRPLLDSRLLVKYRDIWVEGTTGPQVVWIDEEGGP